MSNVSVSTDPRSRLWIHSSAVALFFFSFGWILLLAVFIAVDHSVHKSSARGFLIVNRLALGLLATVWKEV